MRTINLDGTWQFRAIGDDRWREGTVPGTVMSDLLRSGELADPYDRDNEYRVLPTFDRDYEYCRTFALSETEAAAAGQRLRFEGLDTLAEVELNGKSALVADNMFRTHSIDATGMLKAGENRLLVRFRSPVRYMLERNAADPLFGIPMVIPGYTHLRKAHYMSGWDWGPKLPDCGIWRSVRLELVERARIEDVLIRQDHRNGEVKLSISLRVQEAEAEAEALEGEATASGRLREARILVTAPDGRQFACGGPLGASGVLECAIPQPELWWPNGFGEQPLYRVAVGLAEDGATIDERTYSIGLRALTVNTELDEYGSKFAFRVNGIDIFSMGADYIPEDNVLGRLSRERTERLLRDCVRANFNTIRVWGGGFYPDDAFYELCDELGLIVWQDFMFACGVYPLGPVFNENALREAEDNVRRIRHHACLGLLCGNNEIEMFFEDGRIANTPENRESYVAFFERALPDKVRELAPDTFYWPGSPSSGGDFYDTNGDRHGDGHYWDVWHGNKPFTAYRDTYFRYCSEFGFESMPDMRTIEAFTAPEDRNLFSYVMECHQKNPAGNQKILTYLSETYRYPKDLAALSYVSQLLQAEAMRYAVEHWRRNRGRCMGALYWQLNDCWPTLSWSSIDYYGRWKALHYAARRFYSPVLASACEEGTSVSLHVTNETLQPLSGQVEWALRSLGGETLEQGRLDASIPMLSAVRVAELDFAARLPAMTHRMDAVLTFAFLSEGVRLSAGTAYFVPPKYLALKQPNMQIEYAEEEDRFVLMLSCSAVAKDVQLGFRTLDAICSDNYFDLIPGVPKRVDLIKAELPVGIGLEGLRAELSARSLVDSY